MSLCIAYFLMLKMLWVNKLCQGCCKEEDRFSCDYDEESTAIVRQRFCGLYILHHDHFMLSTFQSSHLWPIIFHILPDFLPFIPRQSVHIFGAMNFTTRCGSSPWHVKGRKSQWGYLCHPFGKMLVSLLKGIENASASGTSPHSLDYEYM
jgi:hypothetical protein